MAFFLVGAKPAPHKKAPAHTKTQPAKKGSLEKSNFEEILDRYLFIGDFSEKPAERPISGEVFWRYPFKLAPQSFELALDKATLDAMVFRVPGEGRLAEHFAKGRVEFLEGHYDEAHATWLAGRQQFDKDPQTNKRLEFLLAVNTAQLLREKLKTAKGNIADPEVRRMMNRLSYFLSAVYILRRDVAEPQVDANAAWGLYNLTVVYYSLERWSLVFGSAQEGLTILLKQGKKDFRPKLRQMLAEIYIKNQDLLPAIQELDTAIRQDPDPIEASRMFNRAGDIYYGLNNFELADEVYSMASRIDETRTQFVPGQALLKAESMFWMGRFAEARGLMQAAMEASIVRDRDWLTVSQAMPWVRLRIADTWLAQLEKAKEKDRKKIADEARLAYFRVESEHPNTDASRIAQVRGACMELPNYEGNNVKHARELLASVQEQKNVPEILNELIEACYVGSFSDRERTPEMVAKVKEFSSKYPTSKFLEKMIPAVRDVQAKNIEPYFEKGFLFSATEFFEKKRKVLYPKVPEALAVKLYAAYVDTSRSEPAKEFWPVAKGKAKTDDEKLRDIVFLSEVSGKDKKGKIYEKEFQAMVKDLEARSWGEKPTAASKGYLMRIINGSRANEQLLWVLPAVERWSENEPDSVCSVVYPMTARIFDNRKDVAAKKAVLSRVEKALPSQWEGLAKISTACAQSWLDLEARVFGQRDLTNRYAARDEWKLEGPWLERLWTHSEELEKSGKHEEANKIWQRLAKDAPAESFEARMAKTRLAPRATEVEALWK